MILVVIGHAGAPSLLCKFIYGFHMPLFFSFHVLFIHVSISLRLNIHTMLSGCRICNHYGHDFATNQIADVLENGIIGC